METLGCDEVIDVIAVWKHIRLIDVGRRINTDERNNKMVRQSKKSLTSAVALAKIISKLCSPDSIVNLIQRLDDSTINQLIGLIANLIHNKKLQNHPLLSPKLKSIKKKMHSSAPQWIKLVNRPSANIRSKRKTLIKQAGSGSLWQIISSVLPVLVSLVL